MSDQAGGVKSAVATANFDAAAARQLGESEEAKALGEGPRAGAERFEQSAIAYVKKARELGVHPLYWGIKFNNRGGGYYHSHQGGDLHGAMAYFLGRKHSAKGVAVLAEAGATPWMVSAQTTPRGSKTDALGGREGVKEWMTSQRLASMLMGEYWSLTAQKAGLKSALSQTPQSAARDFMKELLEAYEAATGRASKTSKGVLGKADKRAKDCAAVIIHCKKELQVAAAAWAAAGVAGAEEAPALAAKLVAAAEECLAAKADKAAAAVNPEKVRKQATPEQRLRASALIALCRDFSGDEELVRLAFESTPWLAQSPMLASVTLGRDGSLFAAALSRLSRPALSALEKAGANIWLAAAQAGEGNACAWVAKMLARSEEADVSQVARLLMIGSWLDGAPDPKARCLELAREATESVASPYYEGPQKIARKLTAEIERLTLSELLDSAKGGEEAGEEEQQQHPARRRSAL